MASNKKKKKIKAPSGLTISRDGTKYFLEWSRGGDYSSQDARYFIQTDKDKSLPKDDNYKKLSPSAKATSKKIPFDNADYYPSNNGKKPKVKQIVCYVKGKKGSGSWHKSDKKKYELKVPKKPTVSSELVNLNSTAFSWSIDVATNDNKPYVNYEWQTLLLRDSDQRDGTKVNWNRTVVRTVNDNNPQHDSEHIDWNQLNKIIAGTGTGTSFNRDIIEDSNILIGANYSYTRWFRVRSRGPAGDSAWAYSSHVYSDPLKPTNVSADATLFPSGAGYTVTAKWKAPNSTKRPQDVTIPRYNIITPLSYLVREEPIYNRSEDYTVRYYKTYYEHISGNVYEQIVLHDGEEHNPWEENWYEAANHGYYRGSIAYNSEDSNWTSVGSITDTKDWDGITFNVSGSVPENQCMFFSVEARHDGKEPGTESDPVIVTNAIGKLSKPRITSLECNKTEKRIYIEGENTSLENSFVAIHCCYGDSYKAYWTIGIINGAGSFNETLIAPVDWGSQKINIGLQTIIGTYTPADKNEEYGTNYEITEIITSSDIVWDTGVPLAPENVVLTPIEDRMSIEVAWDWNWTEADSAELSWADHDDAWESTSEPSRYTISNVHSGRWRIAGLTVGTWYVRVRLIRTTPDGYVYGIYSNTVSTKLASQPATPSLTIVPSTVALQDSFKCTWAYTAIDGTTQKRAEIVEYDPDNQTYSAPIFQTESTAQSATMSVSDLGWQPGTKHYLCMKVISSADVSSGAWSEPATVDVVEPLTITIDSITPAEYLENYTYQADAETGDTKTVLALKDLPITVTASGVEDDGTLEFSILRNADFHIERPDENDLEGYLDEVIATQTISGSGSVIFKTDAITVSESDSAVTNLIRPLDDTAKYRIEVVGRDTYGQKASATPVEFEVHWNHQAVSPDAEIVVDEENYIVTITPTMPETGYEPGDTCDIYRLSVDKPQLIVENAQFGFTYVDPYPTLGKYGGHKVVYKTRNGDYKLPKGDDDGDFAFADFYGEDTDMLDVFAVIIDFDDDRVVLPFDISLSHTWNKDFIETKYLGGTVVGDWNPAVSRTGSIETRVLLDSRKDDELVTIEALRRLAVYSGICHVRTPDGSSFAADVEVSENREERWVSKISSFSMTVTRVESEGFDGELYSDWLASQEEV